jgi:hypothetical protein
MMFASFAMLVVRGQREGPRANASRLAEVADFRVSAPPGAQISAQTYF